MHTNSIQITVLSLGADPTTTIERVDMFGTNLLVTMDDGNYFLVPSNILLASKQQRERLMRENAIHWSLYGTSPDTSHLIADRMDGPPDTPGEGADFTSYLT
jgi:hypothetical protein